MRIFFVPALALVMLCFCQRPVSVQTKRFFKMDTVSDITVVTNDKVKVEQLWKSADSLLTDFEGRYSVHGEKSEIRRLNERTSDTMVVSPRTAEMIAIGAAYGDTSGGDVDLTVLPIKELWGFGENSTGNEPPPTDSAVKATLKYVNYKNVKVQHDTVIFLSHDTKVDVGGIAGGYALRELKALVQRYGFNNFLIVSGGDIICGGKRADGNAWRIGIQHPRMRDSILAVVDLDSGVIETSGDYEQFKIIDGKRVHHIFDTKTGYSATKNQSATVWTNEPVRGDLMKKVIFCKKAQDALDYVKLRPHDLECLVVDSSGAIYISDGWKNKVKLLR